MTLAGLVVRSSSALLSALIVLVGLSACGSSSPAAAISAATASTLNGDVQRISSAAADHHAQLAHVAVSALRSDISALVARRELSPSDARVLMTEASQVNGRISLEVKAVSAPPTTQTPAVTASTPTATPPVPAAPGRSDGSGPDKGKVKGPGHGHGGD